MPIRTDLALEAVHLHQDRSIDGITQEEYQTGRLKVTRVKIQSHAGEKKVGKPIGDYITVESPPFSQGGAEHEEIETIAREISSLLPQPLDGCVLVAGLGNFHITPDALGPRTADYTLATRHAALSGQEIFSAFSQVAVLSPGVLGQTGVEAGDLIHGTVREIGAAALVVIDALAASSLSRLGNTVQITNTGISPGAGVQNSRKEISPATMGIPVVAVGIPTVVDAGTLAQELLGKTAGAKDTARMIVTPRDIDEMIEKGAKLLAASINRALQPNLSQEDIASLTM